MLLVLLFVARFFSISPIERVGGWIVVAVKKYPAGRPINTPARIMDNQIFRYF